MLRYIHNVRCFLWRQNNPEVNYSNTRISGGGGGGFLGEAPRSRQRKGDIVLGTWNVGSLYRAGSLTAKMDLQEVGGGCEEWMELVQDRDR